MSLLHASYRRGGSDQVKVPVVLPLVQVRINDVGLLDVTIDQTGYDTDPSSTREDLHREDLHRVLDQITNDLACPVKVEIHEPDGSVFTDIITPTPRPTAVPESQSPSVARTYVATVPGEVAGDGFLPYEEVVVAVIVAHQRAEADGTARLRLPPALLAGRPGSVVLFGRSSGAVALSDSALSVAAARATGGVG